MRRCLAAIILAIAVSASAQPAGVTIDAARFEFDKPWELRANVVGASDGTLLTVPDQLESVEAVLDPKLEGPHMIYIGLHYEPVERDARYYAPAVHVRLDTDDYRVFFATRKPFEELPFKPADMTGRKLIIASLSERPVYLDYVRFEPISQEQFAEYEAKRLAPHEKDVTGINDVNVWMWVYTGRSEWDFKDIVGQHKFAGYNRMYWMANAGAIFYHTDVGTRYVRDTREFTPRSGYMIENFRPLESGVKYAHEQGMEILGWYRLNNNFASPASLKEFGDGLNSEFFMEHPEYRCVYANGNPDHSRYSFAFPEVRAYVRAICVEMVEKGVDGLLLDLLRHPPLAIYEAPLVDGYMAEFGVDPRKIKSTDKAEYARWIKYRADKSFTQFVRELKADLVRIGKPVPIGIRCALAEFEKNTAWCMDVEELVKQDLLSEICLMNGYLGKPDLTHRPDEIARVSEPYFELCEGKNIKLIGGMHGPSVSPEQTREYTRFFHEAGYDGVAIYESDMMINDMRYRALYPELKVRLKVEKPWVSVSSASNDQLVPWSAERTDEAPWWQLNLPEKDTLGSLRLSFGPSGNVPKALRLSVSDDGRRWTPAGRAAMATGSRDAVITEALSGKHFRAQLEGQAPRRAEVVAVSAKLKGTALKIGERKDGRVQISSHPDEAEVKPGVIFEAKVQGDPQRSQVEFYWDGAPVRTERDAPFTWYTPESLRPGRHMLKVRVPDNPLAPSINEIAVTVVGPEFSFGDLPDGARVIAEEQFDEWTLGEPWFLSRGYGENEEKLAPEGYVEVQSVGGSPAMHLVWSGDGPRMLLNLGLGEPVVKGMAEFDFMLPDAKNARLAGLYEGRELNGAIYLNDGTRGMTYNSGTNSHEEFSPKMPTTPGVWHHVKWEWDAGSDRQVIFIDDMDKPLVSGSAMRHATTKGIDRVAFFCFEDQPAELYVDNVRVVAY